MENGTSPEVIRQFNRIALLPDQWDHNRQYRKFLLDRIGNNRESALDVGCGTGEFTRELAARCRRVTGIDVADNMIEEAGKRNALPNIEYRNVDAAKYLAGKENEFDVIASIATLHHLDMEAFFRAARQALRPGGVLLVLDLYKQQTLSDFLLSLTAVICNPLWHLLKRGRISQTETERKAWQDHAASDVYDTLRSIKMKAREFLGEARIRRHLFWRYSLVYGRE